MLKRWNFEEFANSIWINSTSHFPLSEKIKFEENSRLMFTTIMLTVSAVAWPVWKIMIRNGRGQIIFMKPTVEISFRFVLVCLQNESYLMKILWFCGEKNPNRMENGGINISFIKTFWAGQVSSYKTQFNTRAPKLSASQIIKGRLKKLRGNALWRAAKQKPQQLEP